MLCVLFTNLRSHNEQIKILFFFSLSPISCEVNATERIIQQCDTQDDENGRYLTNVIIFHTISCFTNSDLAAKTLSYLCKMRQRVVEHGVRLFREGERGGMRDGNDLLHTKLRSGTRVTQKGLTRTNENRSDSLQRLG